MVKDYMIGICNTDSGYVPMFKARGDEEYIKELLVSIAKEDIEKDEGAFTEGVESTDDVEELKDGGFNAYACFEDYHINYTAEPLDIIKEVHKCSLCGGIFCGYGNNPEPLRDAESRCCDRCNNEYVLKTRLMATRASLSEEDLDIIREVAKKKETL